MATTTVDALVRGEIVMVGEQLREVKSTRKVRRGLERGMVEVTWADESRSFFLPCDELQTSGWRFR